MRTGAAANGSVKQKAEPPSGIGLVPGAAALYLGERAHDVQAEAHAVDADTVRARELAEQLAAELLGNARRRGR